MGLSTPQEIVAFWREAGPDKWFERDDGFDAAIRERFLETHEAAASGALAAWEGNAEGALALLILLDQFPRNMFRGTPRAFATDARARAIADRAIAQGFDTAVAPQMRSFFYLPFMHSEKLADQERCVALYRAAGDQDGLKYADEHADIIRRFGRFPHRNVILGRTSTPEEKAFLEGGGFSG
ncbi:MAG: DUF924 family protein [Pseudorhodoplanes sp.]|nr:DUF924 family protein [Pseudorhodoplanes sp.]